MRGRIAGEKMNAANRYPRASAKPLAQSSSLLDRGFPIRRPRSISEPPEFSKPFSLEAGDSSGSRAALPRAAAFVVLLAGIVLLATRPAGAEESHLSPQQGGGGRRDEQSGRAYKERITPHWFATNTQFWYRNDLPGGVKEFILVNANRGTRQRAFDHQKLAKALSTASGQEFTAGRLPFESIDFIEEGKSVRPLRLTKRLKICRIGSWNRSI